MVKQSTIERNARIRRRFQVLKKGSTLKDKQIHEIIAGEEYVEQETVRHILMLGKEYSHSRHRPKTRATAR